MCIITIDHKRWRQKSKRHNADGRLYLCLLEVGHTLSEFQRLVRSRVDTTDRLTLAGGHPLPTGLESTNPRSTGLTHDRGTFSETVLESRGEVRNGRDRPTSKASVGKEGSKSTWGASRRGGDGSITLTYVSIGGSSIQPWNRIL